MKRFIPLILSFFCIALAAQTPPELAGIWHGRDRYVLFGNDGNIAVLLKAYYGWYYDRAAEPEDFAETDARTINSATTQTPQQLTATYTPLETELPAWEIEITYGGKGAARIPVAVFDDKLYLDFFIRSGSDTVTSAPANPTELQAERAAELENGSFWYGVNAADAIRIFAQTGKAEIAAWYIGVDAAYKLRFWRTDMEYDEDAAASCRAGNAALTVKKHLRSAAQTYTAVSGRGKNIRNVKKYASLPFDTAIYTDKAGRQRIAARVPAYLEKVNSGSKTELLRIVKEANARRAPVPPSPFPPRKSADWELSLLENLEEPELF